MIRSANQINKKIGINKDMYFQVGGLAPQIEDKYFIKTTISVGEKKELLMHLKRR